MKIILYDLVPIDEFQKITPFWVKIGGQFQNRETKQLVGIANETYLPDYIQVLSKEELSNYILEQHKKYPYETIDYETYTSKVMAEDDILAMIDNWLSMVAGE